MEISKNDLILQMDMEQLLQNVLLCNSCSKIMNLKWIGQLCYVLYSFWFILSFTLTIIIYLWCLKFGATLWLKYLITRKEVSLNHQFCIPIYKARVHSNYRNRAETKMKDSHRDATRLLLLLKTCNSVRKQLSLNY